VREKGKTAKKGKEAREGGNSMKNQDTDEDSIEKQYNEPTRTLQASFSLAHTPLHPNHSPPAAVILLSGKSSVIKHSDGSMIIL
jgi:hypothetical protein